MTTVTNVKGTNLTLLDVTQPFIQLTAGEGHRGAVKFTEDALAWSTTMGSAAGNYGTFCRFPSNVKLKRVRFWYDAVPDASSAQALAVELGVSFSDSTIDGTPAQYQGLIPTTTGVGGGTTTSGTTVAFATHTAANALFGTWTLAGNNVNPGVLDAITNSTQSTYP